MSVSKVVKKRNYINVVNMLNAGANINHYDYMGNTGLIYAVHNEDYNMIELLLSRGADINHLNGDGDNALTIAAYSGNYRIFKRILDYKPHTSPTLPWVCKHGHTSLLKVLISNGANVNWNNGEPLTIASLHGQLETVAMLIEANADVYQSEKALVYAYKKKYCKVANLLMKYHKEGLTKGQCWSIFKHAWNYEDNKNVQMLLNRGNFAVGCKETLEQLFFMFTTGYHKKTTTDHISWYASLNDNDIATVKLFLEYGIKYNNNAIPTKAPDLANYFSDYKDLRRIPLSKIMVDILSRWNRTVRTLKYYALEAIRSNNIQISHKLLRVPNTYEYEVSR